MGVKEVNQNGIYKDAFRGCLVGGAIGDALGYPVEFMHEEEIFAKYGKNGIREYELTDGKALISDDTQMTLFTATGILLGMTRGINRGVMADPWDYPRFAYKTWYRMQMGQNPRNDNGYAYSWLADVPEMGERRAPGNTCLSAIKAEVYGSIDEPINKSKGCGGIMRVAPVGLYFGRSKLNSDNIEFVDEVAASVAALTHGHELGWLPAAALAHIVNRLVYTDMILPEAVDDAIEHLRMLWGDRRQTEYLIALMKKAFDLTINDKADTDNIRGLGEGWVAEETLAISLYCALKYPDEFSKAICAAVNHNGDSDSTGAVTGNILGAMIGYRDIPDEWKENLECIDVILEVADDLCHDCQIHPYGNYSDLAWDSKYIDNKKFTGVNFEGIDRTPFLDFIEKYQITEYEYLGEMNGWKYYARPSFEGDADIGVPVFIKEKGSCVEFTDADESYDVIRYFYG